jgi:hypothetical protein
VHRAAAALPGRRAKAVAQGAVHRETSDGIRQASAVAARNEDPVDLRRQDLARASDIRRHDRKSGRRGFEHDVGQPFCARGLDRDIKAEVHVTSIALAWVGDNPVKDFIGPRELGWLTVRLRQPEQLYWRQEAAGESHEPDAEIGSPAELPNIIVAGGRP